MGTPKERVLDLCVTLPQIFYICAFLFSATNGDGGQPTDLFVASLHLLFLAGIALGIRAAFKLQVSYSALYVLASLVVLGSVLSLGIAVPSSAIPLVVIYSLPIATGVYCAFRLRSWRS
jgi:hypothetical protein